MNRTPPPDSTLDAQAREKLAFLRDGRHLAGRPRTVRVIETHFAWVFLAGRWAYKLKKATRQGSMDYRTVARREAGCRAELRLNRRLAPHVYLGVVPLVRAASGGLALGGRGSIADWVIEMRRLPAARMLDRAIERGAVRSRDLDRVMRRLAGFFRHAEPHPSSDRAYLERLRAQVHLGARELRAPDLALSRSLVERVASAQLRFIEAGAAVFAGRGARLADGHGDLRPEHVFLGSPSLDAGVIDCLEFDADLRRLDPAEEMAFLALECERLGAAQLGARLIERYRRIMRDPVPPALLHFYMSRRAAVRAQIAAWHLRDETFAGERELWIARAHSYLVDAQRHLHLASVFPRVPAVRGVPEACDGRECRA